MTRPIIPFVLLLGLLGTAPGQAQFTPGGGGGMGHHGGPGGGDREGMRTRMEALGALNLEGMWGVLNFGIGVPMGPLEALRAPFQENWDRRLEILDGADQKDQEAWEAIRDEFKSMRKELDDQIKKAIGEDKYKEYTKRMKDREKLFGGRMGGPGGG